MACTHKNKNKIQQKVVLSIEYSFRSLSHLIIRVAANDIIQRTMKVKKSLLPFLVFQCIFWTYYWLAYTSSGKIHYYNNFFVFLLFIFLCTDNRVNLSSNSRFNFLFQENSVKFKKIIHFQCITVFSLKLWNSITVLNNMIDFHD